MTKTSKNQQWAKIWIDTHNREINTNKRKDKKKGGGGIYQQILTPGRDHQNTSTLKSVKEEQDLLIVLREHC